MPLFFLFLTCFFLLSICYAFFKEYNEILLGQYNALKASLKSQMSLCQSLEYLVKCFVTVCVGFFFTVHFNFYNILSGL